MANILMINVPAEGHVKPSFGIVKAFAYRGDNVYYVSTEKYKERLEGVGANVILHEKSITKLRNQSSPEGIRSFLHVLIQTSLDTLSITKELAKDVCRSLWRSGWSASQRR